VILLAKQEAKRFNHDYIGTEHILLGLLREGEGVAAAVLQSLGMNLNNIRLEVEKTRPGRPDHRRDRRPALHAQGEKK